MTKKQPSDGDQGAFEGRTSPWHLEYAKLTRFGSYANLIVGPFKPGLNVVCGANESGKTTINQLVRAVLFGWPAARGKANAYRPEDGDRAGSLFFTNRESGETQELKRAKNTVTDAVADFTSDVDEGTYDTMFALTSEELLRLDRHTEVTARLLTAGSGTSSSPAQALTQVNDEIAALMTRSASKPDSIPNLRAQEASLRDRVADASDEASRLRSQERRLNDLEPRRAALSQAQATLNSQIEDLRTHAARLESLDAREQQTREALASLDAAERSANRQLEDDGLEQLVELSPSEEYRLRDTVDDLLEQRSRFERAVESAKAELSKSQAEYDVFVSDEDIAAQRQNARRARRFQMLTAVAVVFVLVLFGAFVAWQGWVRSSILYLATGCVCVVGALVLGAAVVSQIMRPSKQEERVKEQRRKVEWVVRQDKKALEAAERDLADHRTRVGMILETSGLHAAHGSLRHAQHLLERAAAARERRIQDEQANRSLAEQRKSLDEQLSEVLSQRAKLCRKLQVQPQTALAQVAERIASLDDERASTLSLLEEANHLRGQLSQELAAARADESFDSLKLEHSQAEARLAEAHDRLVILLIARHALERSIADWEQKSQPEVYARASRLLDSMTKGAWKQVRITAEGSIEVLDALRSARQPELLSLGTRQQLYLALRIALLITAGNVGRALPVLCDDILVNFDESRRAEAIRALSELALHRQVILFTCHKNVAKQVAKLDSSSNIIEL